MAHPHQRHVPAEGEAAPRKVAPGMRPAQHGRSGKGPPRGVWPRAVQPPGRPAVKASEVNSNMTQALGRPLPSPVKKLDCQTPRRSGEPPCPPASPLRPARSPPTTFPPAPSSTAPGKEGHTPIAGGGPPKGANGPTAGSGEGRMPENALWLTVSTLLRPAWAGGARFKETAPADPAKCPAASGRSPPIGTGPAHTHTPSCPVLAATSQSSGTTC